MEDSTLDYYAAGAALLTKVAANPLKFLRGRADVLTEAGGGSLLKGMGVAAKTEARRARQMANKLNPVRARERHLARSLQEDRERLLAGMPPSRRKWVIEQSSKWK